MIKQYNGLRHEDVSCFIRHVGLFSGSSNRMDHFGLSHILLEPDKYNPDTLDLLVDEEAREYWLNTCEKLTEKYVNFALLNNEDPTVEIRALKFKTCYVEALKEIRINPV